MSDPNGNCYECGCPDDCQHVARLTAEVEALRRERDRYRQWYEALSATRFTQAEADRDAARAEVARLTDVCQRTRRAVDDAARIRVAGATEMGQYARLMDAMAILDAALAAKEGDRGE